MTDIDYKSSGVDVQAGEEAVKSIKQLVRKSYSPNVLSDLGSFGGLYRFDAENFIEPILVSSTDGVGTKLRVAIMAGRFDTIGQDLVNHCVNDILVQGAIPMFFLDYIGVGKLDPLQIKDIISGLVKACCDNSCALIGGEMAEMPGIYQKGDFDLVGTIVGSVDRKYLLPSQEMKGGDYLIALPSSGLHTNGYSLARKIVFDMLGLGIDSYVEECSAPLAELLLQTHTSFLNVLKPLLRDPDLKGLAHITGGGIGGNLKRIIPDGLCAIVDSKSWDIPVLFQWLQKEGKLKDEVIREAFNLGIGMIAVGSADLIDKLPKDSKPFVIGRLEAQTKCLDKVMFC